MQDVVDLAKLNFMAQDANDLLAMAATWRAGDPSANPVHNGDFEKALRSISARGLVMPCESDLYFRVSDNKREVDLLRNAELAPIQSDYGHLAGAGLDPQQSCSSMTSSPSCWRLKHGTDHRTLGHHHQIQQCAPITCSMSRLKAWEVLSTGSKARVTPYQNRMVSFAASPCP